ncbi:MAG: long-chain fatty acid--CoA ligase, partial [Bacteroidetes bacterium]|nr:long-chain fatty acid--CoA ligase [Candidatus Egerieousia excrementavium]
PISQADMETLCRILPDTRLYNTYASTESGILCTYNFNPSCGGEECIAGCLGRPMKHSRVFITENGTVSCSGKTLMLGYAADRAATETIMKDGLLYMNDCGRIDERGRLHLTGRKDDTINVGGLKVSPVEVENAALSHPSVADCICIAEEHPLMGNRLKLLVVPADGEKFDKREIARYLGSRLESYKIPALYQTVESVRRTYNGKIDRKHYRPKS